MTPSEGRKGFTSRERFEAWFFETLRAYKIEADDFAKPAESLADEVWKGEALIKKLFHNGVPRLMALRHSVLLEITHFNLQDLKTYRLGEAYREFPSGKRAIRFPNEKLLSETVCAGDGEDGYRAALRCLAEEAGILRPQQGLLLPKAFRGDLIKGIPGAHRLESQALLILRESDAFKGMLSGSIVREYGYAANPEEWNDGQGYLSVDEHGVTTYAAWEAID